LNENIPLILGDNKSEYSNSGVILSAKNICLFPNWCFPEQNILEDLESLLEYIMLTSNEPDSVALHISTEFFHDYAESLISIAATNVTIKLLDQDHSIQSEPHINLIETLNSEQWKRLLKHVDSRYVCAHELMPAQIEDVVLGLPVFNI
jgi:hypothetical protein